MFSKIYVRLILLIGLAAWGQASAENNFSAHVDLLYWKAHEKSLILTNKKSPIFFTDDFTKAKVIHPHFDWNLGYRIGVGYSFPCSPWKATLDWTHYDTKVRQHRATNSNDLTNVNNQQGMFPIWALSDDIIAGDYISKASLKGKLSLNLIDLMFNGRSIVCGKCFEILPYAGIRTAWIRQHANIDYRGGIFLIDIIEAGVSLEGSDHIYLKNDFWGIGPRLGMQPLFSIGHGFSIYGDAAISALGGVFNIDQKETYLQRERFSRHKHETRLRWIGDLAAGISWKKPLCNERYLLTLELGWEYHIFFHQLELKKDAFHIISSNRNLDVQGVTFASHFEF